MLTGLDANGKQRIAFDVEKEMGPFYCSACGEQMILKKGNVRIHHFAHGVGSDCEYGGESIRHMQVKYEIWKALSHETEIADLQMEQFLGDVRPDIHLRTQDGQNIAIEIQNSNIKVEDIYRRVNAYRSRGWALVWVLTEPPKKTIYWDDGDGYEVYRLSKWQRLIADIDPCLYVHQHGLVVEVIRVKRQMKQGKTLKTYFRESARRRVNLLKNFSTFNRAEQIYPRYFASSNMLHIPQALVWGVTYYRSMFY